MISTSKISKYILQRENAKRHSSAYIKKRLKTIIISVLRYSLIICLSYMILYSLLQLISASFTHPYDIGSTSSVWIPQSITLDNIKVAYTIMKYPKAFLYTLGSTTVVMILQMANAAFAGYSFARLRFRGSKLLFGLVILTIIVPPSSLMLPQYIYFRNFDIFGICKILLGKELNLLGEPSSLFILSALGQGLSSGLFVYIFCQFFRGLPKELEEAAHVDGAGFLRTFFRIVLPTAKPSFMTVGVLSFVWNWNDTYFPRLFNPTDNYLRVRLATLSTPSGGSSAVQVAIGNSISKIPPDTIKLASSAYDSVILKAGSLLAIIPLIIFFLIIQKQFVEGVERSGIVG